MYIDLSLLSDPPPTWIQIERIIPWTVEGMSTSFAHVTAIDRGAAGKAMHAGVRDALQVADALSPDGAAASRIRALVVHDNRRIRDAGKS
jgi:hypothetical protein